MEIMMEFMLMAGVITTLVVLIIAFIGMNLYEDWLSNRRKNILKEGYERANHDLSR